MYVYSSNNCNMMLFLLGEEFNYSFDSMEKQPLADSILIALHFWTQLDQTSWERILDKRAAEIPGHTQLTLYSLRGSSVQQLASLLMKS